MFYFGVSLIFLIGLIGSIKEDGKKVLKRSTFYFVSGISLMIGSIPSLLHITEDGMENINNALNSLNTVNNNTDMSYLGVFLTLVGIGVFCFGAKLESKERERKGGI